MSDEVPDLRNKPLLSLDVQAVLPSVTDASNILHNFTLLVCRELVKYMRYFRENYADVVSHHITHDYYKEMSSKSETVLILSVIKKLKCYTHSMNAGTIGSFTER